MVIFQLSSPVFLHPFRLSVKNIHHGFLLSESNAWWTKSSSDIHKIFWVIVLTIYALKFIPEVLHNPEGCLLGVYFQNLICHLWDGINISHPGHEQHCGAWFCSGRFFFNGGVVEKIKEKAKIWEKSHFGYKDKEPGGRSWLVGQNGRPAASLRRRHFYSHRALCGVTSQLFLRLHRNALTFCCLLEKL